MYMYMYVEVCHITYMYTSVPGTIYTCTVEYSPMTYYKPDKRVMLDRVDMADGDFVLTASLERIEGWRERGRRGRWRMEREDGEGRGRGRREREWKGRERG